MATKGDENQESTLLEEFLARNRIDREELGEPPLADSQDPLRDRVHLEIDDEADDDE